jgi:hypothetical protein
MLRQVSALKETCGSKDLPKRNPKTPNSLGLEAVAPCHTGPVAQAERITHGVEVGLDRVGESVGIGGVNLGGCLADYIAVEEGDGLSHCDCDDDEGDEKERVDSGHDEES